MFIMRGRLKNWSIAWTLIAMLSLAGLFADAQRSPARKPAEQESILRNVLPRPERLLDWSPQEKTIGFRSFEKLVPVRRVRRKSNQFLLPYASRELHVSYFVDGQQWNTTTYMEQNDVAGLLILKRGRIVLERYALGFDDQSLWTSFSVAKSITSTLLGAAIAEGSIGNVDDLVVKYLPALKGTAYDGVSLRHVLNMTSGVRWNEDYDDPESDVNRCHRATDGGLGSPLVTYLAKLPREAQPGTKWVYKTAETDLVGEIVMAATGKSLSEYLSEKVWSSFGMERDAFWMLREKKELGGCCLSVSLRDYGRFGQFMLGGGRVGTKDVLPVGWTKLMVAATPESERGLRTLGGTGGYGFQWWTQVDGPGTYSARGIFGQTIHVNPKHELVIVVLSAWPKALDRERRESTVKYLAAVTEAIAVPKSTHK